MCLSIVRVLIGIFLSIYSCVCLAEARELYFDDKKNTNLDGTWLFYPQQFLSETASTRKQPLNVQLPNSFDHLVSKHDFHGSFVQNFTIPKESVGKPIALYIPYQYGAYRLYIDDHLMLKVGVVGDKLDHQTKMAPRLLIFSVDKNNINLRFEFSSYKHIRGGIENTIYIGYEEPIRQYFYKQIIPATWVSGMLVMIAVFMALFTMYRLRYQKSVLSLFILSLFILSFSLRSFFAVPFSYTLFTSISWLWGTRIEYILTSLICLFFLTYIRLALPILVHKYIYYCSVFIILLNFVVILSQVPLIFQNFFFKSFMFSILFFLNMIYGVIILLKEKVKISKINAFAIFIVCLTFIHDYLLGLKVIDSVEIAFYTSCIYFMVVLLSLSRDYALQSQQAIAYNHELLRLNASLDREVEDRTYTVIQLNELLKQQLKLDSLTGAYNRFALNETLQSHFETSKKDQNTLSFFMLDVDFFKKYNDYYGHLKGDEVLKKIVDVLRQILPQDGFLARYGGEEFAIIIQNMTLEDVQVFANQCLNVVRELELEHLDRDDGKKILTISIGGALMNKFNQFNDADSLIRCADLRLYQAKHQRDSAIVV